MSLFIPLWFWYYQLRQGRTKKWVLFVSDLLNPNIRHILHIFCQITLFILPILKVCIFFCAWWCNCIHNTSHCKRRNSNNIPWFVMRSCSICQPIYFFDRCYIQNIFHLFFPNCLFICNDEELLCIQYYCCYQHCTRTLYESLLIPTEVLQIHM